MLISSYTKTSTGYTLTLSLDPAALPSGFDSYDLALSFDPTKAKLSNTTYDFPGELKSVNDTLVSSGKLSVSGLSLSSKISASTALVLLNFTNVSSSGFVVTVNKLNVNGATYVTDATAINLLSSGVTTGGISGISGADLIAPTILTADPISGGSISPSKEFLSFSFNEAVVKGTGIIQLKTTAGVLVENFDIATSSRITVSGATVIIDPTDSLKASTGYMLVIPVGAVKDTSSNSYAGNSNYIFSTTAASSDNIAPVMSSTSPPSGDPAVATTAKIAIKFSESITFSTGQIQLQTSAGSVVQTFSVGSSGVLVSGDTLTLTPTNALSAGTDYQVVVSAAAIKDLAGNAYAGLTNYSFKTAIAAATDISIVSDITSVDEGGTVNFSISAPTRNAGSVVQYQLLGVSRSDVDKALTGSLILSSTKTAQFSVKLTKDLLTEGNEQLRFVADGVQSSVNVNDTSKASIAQTYLGSSKAENFMLTTAVDNVDGGAGIDMAYINGVSTDFVIRIDHGKAFVSQKDSLNIDTLKSVERIEFTDKMLALDVDGVSGSAYRIYKAAFNRVPDSSGIGYWIANLDSGMNLGDMASRFVDSPEFRATYGSKPTNGDFLSKLYINVLGRAADADGYNWWLNEMNTNSSKSMAKVLADFSEGAENQAGVADLIASGIEYTPWFG